MAAAAGVLSDTHRLSANRGGSRRREGGGKHIRDNPGTSGNGLLARLALPDTDGCALDGGLSAESASVAGVLGDFHLLDLLPQRGTISVFPLLASASPALVSWLEVAIPCSLARSLNAIQSEGIALDGGGMLGGGYLYLTPYLPVTIHTIELASSSPNQKLSIFPPRPPIPPTPGNFFFENSMFTYLRPS